MPHLNMTWPFGPGVNVPNITATIKQVTVQIDSSQISLVLAALDADGQPLRLLSTASTKEFKGRTTLMLKTPEDREKAIQQRLMQLETVAQSYKAITGLINDFDKQVSV